jgi:hypothetical protein
MMKRCTICNQTGKFSKDKSRPDGLDATCKKCRKQQRENRKKTSVIAKEKECNSCHIVKSSEHFDKKKEVNDGLHTECKDCKKAKRIFKKGNNINRELPENYVKYCNKCNVEKPKCEFYSNVYSTDGIGTICRDCEKNRSKEWRTNNPHKSKEYRTREHFKNYKNRRISNPQHKISGNIRNRIRSAVRRCGAAKFDKTFELIGCSPKEFREWLEWQFNSKMTWENYGEWEIDHVMPCSYFNLLNLEEQLECFNWRNCRPLFKKANCSKSDKIEPFQNLLQELKVHYYERHAQIAGTS